MATIKFYPYKKKGKSKIYLRLSIKREVDVRLSTGLTIEEAMSWNRDTGLPKKNTATNKKLYWSLKDLEKHIEDKMLDIEKDKEKSIISISSKWLKGLILAFFHETPIADEDLLISFAEQYAESRKSATYQKNGKRIKYSQSTINKYLNFSKQLKGFEIHKKRIYKVSDVDENFAEEFIGYLEKKGLATNTIGRFVKRLKTIVKEAETSGIVVNTNFRKIQGFEDETIVTFLTFKEIDLIINKQMPTERLKRAKDWLIIGCYTAQRISDMYRMKKSMIISKNSIKYISLTQYKTGKKVMIPLHYKVEDVLKKHGGDFPENFNLNEKSNRSTLSKLVKEVCRVAGINEVVRGRYNGEISFYPKYKLIHNHSTRRSFASNFYGLEGWTTPMIMEITGHETEKSFYKYIDKENFYLSEQVGKKFAMMKEEDLKEKRTLRVIKKASN